MPNDPKIAFEVWDIAPDDWSPTLNDVYGDVYADPIAWTKKVVEEYGADLVYLRLKSTDPNGAGRSRPPRPPPPPKRSWRPPACR